MFFKYIYASLAIYSELCRFQMEKKTKDEMKFIICFLILNIQERVSGAISTRFIFQIQFLRLSNSSDVGRKADYTAVTRKNEGFQYVVRKVYFAKR